MTLWPRTLFGRTLAVLLAGIVLTAVIFGGYQALERRTLLTTIGGWHGIERIADVIERVENASATERDGLLASIETPGLQVVWSQDALLEARELDWQGRQVRRALEWFLDSVAPEQIRMKMARYGDAQRLFPHARRSHHFEGDRMSHRMWRDGWRDRWRGDWLDMPHHDDLGRRKGAFVGVDETLPVLLIAYQLKEGTWLTFLTPPAPVAPFWGTRFFLPSVLALLLVLGVSIWAVRRSTKPLSRFTVAAERLGLDVNAAPMDESGPYEVRRAAKAFNRMQRRLQAFVKDRTHMLAAISHDLRTPITRLRLRAELIDDDVERDKMLVDLEEMEAMISATLQFARDDVTAEPTTNLDLAQLIIGLCQDAQAAGQKLDYSGPDQLAFVGRKVALKRMVSNIIGNAGRYAMQAVVSLDTSAEAVTLCVEDDGPGIPDDMRERVFDPFVRVEGSRSRDTGGTGLGLTAVKSIVQAHGGEIELQNRDEGGLRVRIVLPIGLNG